MASKPHLGGSYLKADGTLKRPTTCVVDGRAGNVPGHPGGPRFVEGKFGQQLEIPTKIDGLDFVLNMPADKGDGAELRTKFGEDLSAWIGRKMQVEESQLLTRIRVQPIN